MSILERNAFELAKIALLAALDALERNNAALEADREITAALDAIDVALSN